MANIIRIKRTLWCRKCDREKERNIYKKKKEEEEPEEEEVKTTKKKKPERRRYTTRQETESRSTQNRK